MNKRQLKIAHIMPSLGFGGAERCVVDLINNSDSNKFQFSVITFSENIPMASELNKKIDIITLKKHGKISLHLISDIKSALKKLHPDIVHTHLFVGDVWGRIAAHKLGIPVVSTEHNINNDEGEIKHLIKKWLKNHTSRYVACSSAVKDYMREAYAIKSDIEVIHYGVDLKKFINLPISAFVSPFKLVMLGRLTKQKGHGIALSALSKLKKYDWSLEIVGEGELREELKLMVSKFGMNKRVKFFETTHDVPAVLARNQIILMPSLWEGLGIVAIEAMASRKVIIGSRVGGIPELIQDKVSGILSNANDADSLKDKIEWCFNHPAECSAISEGARKYAIDNFGVEKMVKKYEDVYKLTL